MANSENFIEITDFRPGIHGDFYAGNTAVPTQTSNVAAGNGSATIANTYSCIADRTGALTPLPKPVSEITQTLLPLGNAYASQPLYMNSFTNFACLHDAQFLNSGYTFYAPGTSLNDRQISLSTIYSYRFDPAGGGVHRPYVHGITWHYTSGAWTRTDGIFRSGGGNAHPLSQAASLCLTRRAPTSPRKSTLALFAISREASATGAIPGNEVPFLVNRQLPTGNYSPSVALGPVNTQPMIGMYYGGWSYQTAETKLLANTTESSPQMAIGHQGRVVLSAMTWKLGTEDTRWTVDELRYSDQLDPINTTSGKEFTYLTVGEEQPGRIEVFGVVAADQILVVKSRGGGVLITGDLDFPTVRRMPYIKSTGGAMHKGVSTSVGFIYGTVDGIYAWQGGDTSTCISPQLDGFFWNHLRAWSNYVGGGVEYAGSRGRFGVCGRLVCVPNNFAYDMDNGGWWRLPFIGTEEPYNVYEAGDGGEMYAFPWRLTATQNVVCQRYDWNGAFSDTYSWQSQPLVETRGRTQSFQEVRLIVSATGGSTGTITVTLTGLDVNGQSIATRNVVFTVANQTKPQLLRKDITAVGGGNFTAEYVQVRVQVNSGNAAVAAPKIHALRIGARERATTRRQG